MLWGSAPPPSARVSVQNCVMRLRKALTVTGRALISTQPGGYPIQSRRFSSRALPAVPARQVRGR